MYSTEQEQKFLDGLGSYKGSLPSLPRPKLLMKYYRAMKKRKEWGRIDPIKIKARLKSELGWDK